MDLTRVTEQFGQDNFDWLPNWHVVARNNQALTLRLDDFVELTHYPQGYIQSGTFLGRYTSGVNDTFYGPWDKSAADGRAVIAGILYSGGRVDFLKNNPNRGTPATNQIVVAAVMINAPAEIEVSRLPDMLDGGAPYVPVQADLPAAWLVLDNL